ncbi:MAG: ATP-binding cassette domain-containing protein [Anaerolineae bacterium]
MSPIIETQQLTRHFGHDIIAVSELTLAIHSGEVFGFLGHNGAGKTTTVRLLNGILAPTCGSVRVLGLDPVDEGPKVRRHTGVLTETPSLEERLTARETLHVYGKLYGVADTERGRRVDALLDEFGLSERADEYVGGFSKGMRQRLALARTLIHQPRILFLDEPTTGLDPVGRRSVHELITQLSSTDGRTVFLCTHDLMEAQRLCSRVGVMEQGRLVALGTPVELARDLRHGIQLKIRMSAPPPKTFDGRGVAREVTTGTWDADTRTVTFALRSEDAIPDLIEALVHAGARIYQVTPQEPTLEDVYFAIHDQDTSQERRP